MTSTEYPSTEPATVVADADIWATIAAGARHLPAPSGLSTYTTAGRRHLVLNVPTAADAAEWARWLYLADRQEIVHDPYVGQSGAQREGFVDYTFMRDGWRWTIRGVGQPKPLITDPVELAAAYKLPIDWSRTCPSCGGPVYDGQCQGAEQCEDPKCTRTCCAGKRQGPVAVQRPEAPDLMAALKASLVRPQGPVAEQRPGAGSN